MPPRPTKKPKRAPRSSTTKPAKSSSSSSARLSPTFFLGPFLGLLSLLLLNSSLIDLPNLLVSTPPYLLSLVTPTSMVSPSSLWDLKPSPKGGHALFTSSSNSSIEPGTLLLTDEPLIILPTRFKGTTMEEINEEVKALVEELDEREKGWFYELSAGEEEEGGLGREMRIVKTNGVDVGGDRVGVFRWFSRINHSCRPNAHYVYRPSSNKILLHAFAALPPHTELLLSYLDPFFPTSVRQAQLLERYGFQCDCPRCSNAQLSDERSQEIWRLRGEVGGLTLKKGQKGRIGGKEAKKKLERVLELMDLEGVQAGRGQIAEDLARVAWGVGDFFTTSRWSSRASRWFGEELGKDSEQALSMARMAREYDSETGPEDGKHEAERLGWEQRSVREWEDIWDEVGGC